MKQAYEVAALEKSLEEQRSQASKVMGRKRMAKVVLMVMVIRH